MTDKRWRLRERKRKKNKGNRRMQEPVKMKLINDDSNASGRVTDCVVREKGIYV